MSFSHFGLDAKLRTTSISATVAARDPLIKLANHINWQCIAALAKPDLQCTAKGCWWVGRKLHLRIHLAVMVLQVLLKATDRSIECQVMQTPIYQRFCGYGVIAQWKCPDHTKIEEFRNRLAPETHKKICGYVLQLAVQLGFADPRWMDIDSTVQESNMSYPSDATLMQKLAKKCMKVLEFMKQAKKQYLPNLQIDMKIIQRKAKGYFFLAKNVAMEKKRTLFQEYYTVVQEQLQPMISLCENLSTGEGKKLAWNIRQSVEQIATHGRKYLEDVAYFIQTHTLKAGKILAFHCFMTACISKGKIGKPKEFGRVFQLGRIGGNFIIPFTCTDVRMNDKKNLLPAIQEFQGIFGKDVLKEVATDKGYYSAKNVKSIGLLGINGEGIQRPKNIINYSPSDNVAHLHNRRAGIEPLIGHVKEFGLRRSKMKSDTATLSQGYRSVLGFNLHQLQRKLGAA